MLELGNPPYQHTGDMRTHCALIDAVTAAIPCLTDWANTTGFGETHERDVNALRLCVMAFDVLREEYSRTINIESPAGDWPTNVLKLVSPYKYQAPSRV
jgi:hypothetical protein